MMRVAGRDEGLVVNHGRSGELGLEFTVSPFRDRLAAHRQLAFFHFGEVPGRPLDRLQRDAQVRDIAALARIRSARVQALQRIDDVGQRLVRHPYLL